MSLKVPNGLKAWDKRIQPVLHKPFPPPCTSDLQFKPQLEHLSTWALVCEEVLDTEVAPRFLQHSYEELLRRGFGATEIQEMRHFAWLTAGWLNFEKMLWDWCSLDESDIRVAIERQKEEGLIDNATAAGLLEYMNGKLSKPRDNGPRRAS